jgi:hypothetical protein
MKNASRLASLKVALEEFMLEWKPKLITLILALVIVAALVGLLFPVSGLSTSITHMSWD